MSKKVLIVEDYDDTRELMKLLVESYGYEAIEANNGVDAVLSVKLAIPDLILMDVGLPDLDGITATRIIRKYLNGIEIPIIAVTAFGKPYYERAIEAGCNDLIPKPVDFDSLQPILYRYLGH